jgi:2,3-bisphosphoglycerate-independent phosphoglycerate mutase
VLPIVVVLLDGLGDRAHDVLGGRTGNEAARTPSLDALCARGSCGVLYAVGPGRAPSSEVAHWSMLGYRPDEFPGRAVFEAVGRGQDVSPEHVFAYAALRPAERRDDGWWLTGRPDAERDADEVDALVERCAELEIDGLTFSLTHVWRGEAVLRISGGADPRVTDTDAFFRDRHPVLRPQAVAPEAERTARAAEEWTREAMRRLEGERFNLITLKWWGRPTRVPSFLERHGVGGTFVFVHQKTTDAAGHTKDPTVKQATIERLDAALGELPTDRAVVCLTGDHATPASPDVIHSGDPVPLVIAGPGVRADDVTEFGELTCASGILGQLRGPDLMPLLLNAADRPLFLGSRPTPFDGADGYPALLDPLI